MSSYFYDKMSEFDLSEIDKNKIRPRLFRNWYVLYQSSGYFKHECFTLHAENAIKNKDKFYGTWYGPFWTKEIADKFGSDMVRTYTSFILG